MKWLDPKNHELPFGEAFIAVINLRADFPDLDSILIVKILKHNVNFDYFNDLEEWYEDYGLISAEDYNLKKYHEKDIVAWMPLPLPPKLEKNNEHPELICLFCENKDFTEKKIPFPTEKGIIMTEAFVCKHCGEPLMNSEQMDNFIKLSKMSK